MERHAGLVATVLSALVFVVLLVTLVLDRDFADRLTREDGAVEWLQAALFALAAVFAARTGHARSRAGASPVLEVLVTAMLAGLVIGEIDLDRLLAGRKIISTRFLIDTRVWLGWRVLALLAMALPPVVLAVYALRRRHELLMAIGRAMRESPGRVFMAGVVIFGLTELLEKPFGRIGQLPRYMIEEGLELISGICFFVGVYGRWRLVRIEEKARPAVEERCVPPP